MGDYAWIDDASAGTDDGDFRWELDGLADLSTACGVDMDATYQDAAGCLRQPDAKKRCRNEPCGGTKTKACREKMRRDRLNDRFLELSSVLDPGRPPKSDKAGVLGDAARTLMQLRSEAQELKETNEKLQDAIKDLKVEKTELRDEKIKLKAEKERLEQQIKMLSLPSAGYMPHPAAAYHAAAAAAAAASAALASQNQGSTKNNMPTAPFPAAAYPGLATWQWLPAGAWLPPASLDTSDDPKRVSPSA